MVNGTKSTMLGELSEDDDDNPFKILVATILSQRTRDETISRAADRLFSIYNSPTSLAEADKETIQEVIRPVGFYKVKASRIKEVSRIILEKFNGNVPSNLEDLLSLPSVGRKTANCVLVYGFGKPAIPVDTHVHRVFNRLGVVNTKTPDETELDLKNIISQELWSDLNEYVIRFGKTICKPIGPRCGVCTLNNSCKTYSKRINSKN